MFQKKFLVGVDEAGRGPLAGPVAVAAVVCFPHFNSKKLAGIKDSKQLSAQKREMWFKKASLLKKDGFIDFTVSFSSQRIIDKKGIIHAIDASLKRSLRKICINPYGTRIYLDGGLVAPKTYPFQKTITRGDRALPIIALASIIAKVERDKKMIRFGEKFPVYKFEKHKGYGTAAHYRAIKRHGICTLHRKSFLT